MRSTCQRLWHRRCNGRQQIKGHNGKKGLPQRQPLSIFTWVKLHQKKATVTACNSSILLFLPYSRRRSISTALRQEICTSGSRYRPLALPQSSPAACAAWESAGRPEALPAGQLERTTGAEKDWRCEATGGICVSNLLLLLFSHRFQGATVIFTGAKPSRCPSGL